MYVKVWKTLQKTMEEYIANFLGVISIVPVYFTKTCISLIIKIAKAYSKVTRTMLENSYVWPPIYHDRRLAESNGNIDEPVEVRSRLISSGSATAGSWWNGRERDLWGSHCYGNWHSPVYHSKAFRGTHVHRIGNENFWQMTLILNCFKNVLGPP